MKTKFLLPALALPLMVACTQDELVGQVETNVPQTEERIVVGPVTFVDGNQSVESRLNYFTGNWEDGDKFGLFRMDQRNQEKNIAAEKNFMSQEVWNEMYTITNDYLTNFPFTFNASKSAWENDDKTVEGNYFAVAPANNQKDHLDKLTSSSDVWMYINPVQKIVFEAGETKSNEGIEENQFFLGYTQIYRDQKVNSADGKLQLPLNMQPILANVDMTITNGQVFNYRVEKLVLSRLAEVDGSVSPVPTLAYLKPAGNTFQNFGVRKDTKGSLFGYQGNVATKENIDNFVANYAPKFDAETLKWKWDANATAEANYTNCGPAFAQPYLYTENNGVCGDETYYYWSLDSWTRNAARSVVEYAYPGQDGYTPYGCDYEPAYEYVIEFEDAAGNAYMELTPAQQFRAAFTLPHNLDLTKFNAVIYGQVKVGEKWQDCFIYPKFDDIAAQKVDNVIGAFKLLNVDLASTADYIESSLVIGDDEPMTSRIVKTASSADLLKHLKAYYGETPGSIQLTNNTLFYVETLGDFKISKELVEYVEALNKLYAANTGSQARVYFVRTTGVNGIGQLNFGPELPSNAIDLFNYSKQVTIFNDGSQTIEKPIIYHSKESVQSLIKAWEETRHNGYSKFVDALALMQQYEAVAVDVTFGGVRQIINAGKLEIKTIVETSPFMTGGEAPVWNMEGAFLKLENDGLLYASLMNKGRELNTYIHNDGWIEMYDFEVEGTVENHNVLKALHKESKIENLINVVSEDNCYTCKTVAPTVTVGKDAILEVDDYGFNGEGAVINVNGIIFGEFIKNYGEININETGKGHFNNKPDNKDPYDDHGKLYNFGTINVKGHLAEDIMNQGLINVIGNGNVVVNGALNNDVKDNPETTVEEKTIAGIIDVTKANAGTEACAKDKSNDTGKNYFRYDVQDEETATDLISALKDRISQHNWSSTEDVKTNNRIIIRWTAETTATEFSGTTEGMNIDRVIISKDLKIVNRTEKPAYVGANFPHLNDMYYGYDLYPSKGVETPAFVVNATLTVKDYAELMLAEDDYDMGQRAGEELMVLINGKVFAGTASKLGGETVKYNGKGDFEFRGYEENNLWKKGDFEGFY